jgi:two-component system, NarL family, nitrate/nitrite response regulator NarL
MDRTLGLSTSAMAGVERTRVLIVSDVLLYREGLRASLSAVTQLEVVGSATGGEAFARVEALHPDVIILDASTSNGMTLARDLRKPPLCARVIGFGINGDEEEIVSCAEAGLAGFVGSEGTTEDLISAVECSMRGELLCSPRVAALLFNRITSLSKKGIAAPGVNLTRRELEIARLIKEGLSNKEIAGELGIGPATVKNYVHSILEKLSVRRRSAVAARLGS